MRPRGCIRSVFSEAASRMVEPGGGVTWRAVAEETQIGFDIARSTMENMVRSGEWERVGSEKRANSSVWHGLYAPSTIKDIWPEHISEAPTFSEVE